MEDKVNTEEIYNTLNYGKIVRLRKCQVWLGKDEQGLYIDIHASSEDTLNKYQVEFKESGQSG